MVDLTAFYTGTTDPLRGNYEDYAAEYARGYRLKTKPRSSPRASTLDSRTRRNLSKDASLTTTILGSLAVFGTGLWLLSNRDSEIKET